MKKRFFNTKVLVVLLTIAVAVSSFVFSKRKKIACVGDSITYGYAFNDPQAESYPGQLQMMLGYDKWDVGNFGINSRTLLKNGDLPYWKESLYQNALSFEADYVVIMLGTNDSKTWIWNSHGKNFVNDYKEMIQSFKKLPSKPEIWICTLIPGEKKDWGILNDVIKDSVNPKISKVAMEMGVGLIDNNAAFLKAKPSWYMEDNIHPTTLGAIQLAKNVKKMLTMKKPVIVKMDMKLIAPQAFGYQWYRNDTIVSSELGGTSQELLFTKPGKYKLSVKPEAENNDRVISEELEVVN